MLKNNSAKLSPKLELRICTHNRLIYIPQWDVASEPYSPLQKAEGNLSTYWLVWLHDCCVPRSLLIPLKHKCFLNIFVGKTGNFLFALTTRFWVHNCSQSGMGAHQSSFSSSHSLIKCHTPKTLPLRGFYRVMQECAKISGPPRAGNWWYHLEGLGEWFLRTEAIVCSP